jgi:hypothetical protein
VAGVAGDVALKPWLAALSGCGSAGTVWRHVSGKGCPRSWISVPAAVCGCDRSTLRDSARRVRRQLQDCQPVLGRVELAHGPADGGQATISFRCARMAAIVCVRVEQ